MKRWLIPLCAVATGLATLAIAVAFGALGEVKAAYPHGDFALALGAFQRATSMSEFYALFGNPPDLGKLAAMTAGNRLDLYGFIPVYTSFMLFSALLLGKARGLTWVPVVAAIVACAGDIVETTSQLAVSTDWAHAAQSLPSVAPGCWTKFFGLAGHAIGCSVLCFTGARKRWILGVVGLAPLIVTSSVYWHLAAPTLMTMVFSVFWIALLAVGVLELARALGGSPQPAPAPL